MYLLGDVFIFVLAAWASFAIRLGFNSLGAVGNAAALHASIWQMAITSAIVKPIVFWALGIYRIYWKYFGSRELRRLLAALLVGSLALTLAIILLRRLGFVPGFPRSVILIDFGLSAALVSFYRRLSRVWRVGPKGSGAG
jgi:FlaA1/EpsC-like NDP-sugar epimerase